MRLTIEAREVSRASSNEAAGVKENVSGKRVQWETL